MTYSEKLKDPRWQKKRLEVFQRDDFTCQLCSDKENTLHTHHVRYPKGRSFFDCSLDDLTTLCELCHSQVEELISIFRLNAADPRIFGAYSSLEALMHPPNDYQAICNILVMLGRMPDLVVPLQMFLLQTINRQNVIEEYKRREPPEPLKVVNA